MFFYDCSAVIHLLPKFPSVVKSQADHWDVSPLRHIRIGEEGLQYAMGDVNPISAGDRSR
jgi:hypothetical protein